MNFTNFSSNYSRGELGRKVVKLEQDFEKGSKSLINPRYETKKSLMDIRINPNNSVVDQTRPLTDDSSHCSTSSMAAPPICRQFWRAGNYDDMIVSKPKATTQSGNSHLHIHPKFLHSNATSHKWAFGAMAELIDNSIDEIQNGATFVIVDKIINSKDGSTALLIQDDGGGMTPETMRRCISFGFSNKKSKTAIGQYGNGFKTSSMRLGADVIVFSRCMKDRKLTQSIGLLSYTFLMQTKQDRILVPMVDYQFDVQSGKWVTLHSEDHHNNNLSILLQWSPVTTEAELLEQCDYIKQHGSRIIIYNLWQNDDGKMELDFESDPEDICLSRSNNNAKVSSKKELNQQHIANRFHYSLRAYLSILYMRVPENFCMILRGRVVEYHSIANDLKFPQFILYKPQNVEGSVLTTIGFLKEAPAVSIHGFNVYHKNRLILPFWHVVTFSDSRGRGVVGVLEANFMEPTHNKQDFEKTPIFQKLETRLKEMTQEYCCKWRARVRGTHGAPLVPFLVAWRWGSQWRALGSRDYHCGLIGYQVKKKPRPEVMSYSPVDPTPTNGIYKPVVLGGGPTPTIGSKETPGAGSIQHHVTSNNVAKKSGISMPINMGAQLKRKGNVSIVEPERVKRTGAITPANNSVQGEVVQHAVDPAQQSIDQESTRIIEENRLLHAQCQEYEKIDEELNLKLTQLEAEVQAARHEHARLLLDTKYLDKVKRECREVRHV